MLELERKIISQTCNIENSSLLQSITDNVYDHLIGRYIGQMSWDSRDEAYVEILKR